jgi:2-phosphosulfolactate phosphatase
VIVDVLFGANMELDGTVVIVDVFRSSTTIVFALDSGAKYVIPCDSVKKAIKTKVNVKNRLEKPILLGEKKGKTPSGFDMNISPQAMTRDVVSGKVLVYTSTNLTKILEQCKSADIVLVGGLVNARAVAKYLHSLKTSKVNIVACGVIPYNMLTLEDVVGAGAIIHNLKNSALSDSAMLCYLVYRNSEWRKLIHKCFVAKYLTKIGFSEDIRYCLQENVSDTIPIFKDGIIVRL